MFGEIGTGKVGDMRSARYAAWYHRQEHNLSKASIEQIEKYHGAEYVPLTDMDRLGEQVANQGFSFSEAMDELMAKELEKAPLDADIDAIEDRLTRELSAAAGRAEARADFQDDGKAIARINPGMSPGMADMLGIDPNHRLSTEETVNLLAGYRADGAPIEGKHYQKPKASIASIFGFDPKALPIGEAMDNILAGKRVDGSPVPIVSERLMASQTMEGARRTLLAEYGIPIHREPTPEEVQRIRQGLHAREERPIHLAGFTKTVSYEKVGNAYFSLVASAHKSVSVAWALAGEAEKTVIQSIFEQATDNAMAEVQKRWGFKQEGSSGAQGRTAGEIGIIGYTHYTTRPTIDLALKDAEGLGYTKSMHVPEIQGDPHLHRHVFLLNVVRTPDGRVGSLDSEQLVLLSKEFGGIQEAWIARLSREHGISIKLGEGGAAQYADVPDKLWKSFTKRSAAIDDHAANLAKKNGQDWETMTPEAKKALLDLSAKQTRLAKQDRPADFDNWAKQAKDLGFTYRSVLRPNEIQPELAPAERHEAAYQASLPAVEQAFVNRAKITGQNMRELALQGLITAGIGDEPSKDVDAVTARFRKYGIEQDKQQTAIVFGREANRRGKEQWAVTTELHETKENEVLRLVKEARAPDGRNLPPKVLADATARYLATNPKIDPDSDVWNDQAAMAHALGSSAGAFSVGIGAAGSGKTTAVLTPLVDAWKQDGREVYGIGIAWRAASALGESGIDPSNRAAIAAFTKRVEKGQYALNRNSVVVVDEVSVVSTRQMLDLLKLREKHGFTLVALGDQRQCQSVEAGAVIDLIDKAMPGTIPEVTKSIRQKSEREREIVGMFRSGDISAALEAKRNDGTAELVAGGRDITVARVAQLWRSRMEANTDMPDFTLSVSAPTRRDARDVSDAIRTEAQAMNLVGPDLINIKAVNGQGENYDMSIGLGDRITTLAQLNNGKQILGSNGDVLEVRGIEQKTGLTLRAADGYEVFVPWEKMAVPETGRLRLAPGFASTIDVAQGITSDEHINALPGGSRETQSFKNYVAESRHRVTSWLVVDESAERRQISFKIPMGTASSIRQADIWQNVVKNLSAVPTKASAIEFIKQASDLRRGTVRQRFAAKAAREEGARVRSERPAPERQETFVERWRERKLDIDPQVRRIKEMARQITQRAIVEPVQKVRQPRTL